MEKSELVVQCMSVRRSNPAHVLNPHLGPELYCSIKHIADSMYKLRGHFVSDPYTSHILGCKKEELQAFLVFLSVLCTAGGHYYVLAK